jgi:hypothetical protein
MMIQLKNIINSTSKIPRVINKNIKNILKKHQTADGECIITNNNNRIYCDSETDKFLEDNEFIKNKKVISISPGGYKGIYMLGTTTYIRKQYNLDNYIFSGASAGAWNALMLTFKNDITHHLDDLLYKNIHNSKTILDLEQNMKESILNKFTTDDFELRRLFIGVTTVYNKKSNTTIFSGFNNLEDALDCCIASSHIPFITGGVVNKYKNMLTFDGGFSRYPYINHLEHSFHINPDIWYERNNTGGLYNEIAEYTTLFSKKRFDFKELYKAGYDDAAINKPFLDSIFEKSNR